MRVLVNPANPTIGMTRVQLNVLQDIYLKTCEAVKHADKVAFYWCPDGVRLPQLTFEVDMWRLLLDEIDYTQRQKNASRVKVLIGQADDSALVLGGPFLRAFPVRFDRANKELAMYCRGNISCVQRRMGMDDKEEMISTQNYEDDLEREHNERMVLIIVFTVVIPLCGSICWKCFRWHMAEAVGEEVQQQQSHSENGTNLALPVVGDIVFVEVDSP